MFNAYATGGRANASANNYLRINAISGTLVKNHPQSIFVRASGSSKLFNPTNPTCVFPKAKTETYSRYKPQQEYVPGRGWQGGYVDETVFVDVDVPCVVLQAMIIGDDMYLCEVVSKADFFGEATDEDGAAPQPGIILTET